MKKIYISISIIILLLALIITAKMINNKYGFIQTQETAQRIYKQGLNDIENGDLQNAYYNFSKISRFNDYYEAALFRQGLAATELNDNESAIKAYETLLGKFSGTFFSEKAVYNLAIAYYNSGLKEKAYANFALINKKYTDSDYADASNYFLGVLTKDADKKRAAEYFINYIKIAPYGKYSQLTLKELSELDINYSQEQYLSIGEALILNNKPNEALNYLNKSNIKEAWAPISIAYHKTGNIKLSKSIFETGLGEFSKNNDEMQQRAIDEYLSYYGKRKALGLKDLKSYCDKTKCQHNDYIMYSLLPYVDKTTKIGYYNRIYEEFPDGNYAADALFNSIFNDYLTGSYDNAIIKAKKYISKYPDKKSSPAVLYWLAKTYEKKNNNFEANNYYNKILSKYKDSYYAYLSYSKLNKIKDSYNINSYTKIPEYTSAIDIPIMHANMSINSSKKIYELLDVKDYEIFENTDFDNDIIKSWVAYQKSDYTKASVIAEKVLAKTDVKPSFDDDIYKLIYPVTYSKEINQYSGKDKNISPYLLLSLIKKESRFNPNAISSVGARGLMQLMPDTASYIAGITGTRYNLSNLYDPEFNIKLGTMYYAYIKQNHHSNDIYAIASYNGGHGAVSKWKNSVPANDIDEFIEQIPYAETKDYIKQVYKNYWMYNSIYNPSSFK